MKSRKTVNPDGSTKHIILNNRGVYIALTPKETAQAINELKAQLWQGVPLSKEDMRYEIKRICRKHK